jgi:predicted CxxxxCH...CXXCH cytochrome family protein
MFRERLLVLVMAIATFAASAGGGCLEPHEGTPALNPREACTSCHGSPSRPGADLAASAPPFDLSGASSIDAVGVGAHLIHLTPNEVHGGVGCGECHVVPEATDSAGHADSALPAEIVFGTTARARGHAPAYNADTQRCSSTGCHLAASPRWIPSQEATARCERCHAMPPPAPHPRSNACAACHGAVVDEDGTIVRRELHVDGKVDVDERCDACHGSGSLGAPPPDLAGRSDARAPGVGAHAVHLEGGVASRPLRCSECHRVPTSAASPGHLDASPSAEVMLAGVAASQGRIPSWDTKLRSCSETWCHGPGAAGGASPRWSEPGALGCDGCHGAPPAAPHPQIDTCSDCHGSVIDDDGAIAAPERHVDGIVDVDLPLACDACHGDDSSAAPPFDLAGNTSTLAPGVGAHRAHVEGSGIARPVPCSECHQVPRDVLSSGHIDTASPAELRFSGVARAFEASPSYDGTRCVDSYCHGDRFVLGHESGGVHTEPVWTTVDGTQKSCTSCHGLPPPAPHPPGPSFCSDCHGNVGPTLQILDPDSHVNGVVDF